MLSSHSGGARAHATHQGSSHGWGVRRSRVIALLAGCVAMAAVAAVAAVPAGAKVVIDSATGKKIGYFRAIRGSAPAGVHAVSTSCTTNCTLLIYHNNAPVQHVEKEYLFFWSPSNHPMPSAYKSGMATWLTEASAHDYGTLNPFSVMQQYYDVSGPSGAKRFVPYNIINGGSLIDTNAYPANGCSDTDGAGHAMSVCLTQSQLITELSAYITAHNLPTGFGVQYYIMTPPGVGSCFDATNGSCSYTQYCAWHSSAGSASSPTLYADMPWSYNVSGCDVNLAFGAGYPNADGIDPVVGVFSHELSETATDPLLNAWLDSSGSEIGDKCAYIYGAGGYGSLSGLQNNGLGYWNVSWGSDSYLMQQEFDNRLANCSTKDGDVHPSATVNPTTATHGVSQTFTATVTDSLGVAYIDWNFGDGSTAQTATTSTSHTYATAGTRTLSAVVTDNHGNEVKVPVTITVS